MGVSAWRIGVMVWRAGDRSRENYGLVVIPTAGFPDERSLEAPEPGMIPVSWRQGGLAWERPDGLSTNPISADPSQ